MVQTHNSNQPGLDQNQVSYRTVVMTSPLKLADIDALFRFLRNGEDDLITFVKQLDTLLNTILASHSSFLIDDIVNWERNETLLQEAAYEGALKCVKELLRRGASVHYCRDRMQGSALQWAVAAQQMNVVTYLLMHTDSDVNQRSIQGYTCLMTACWRHMQQIESLVELAYPQIDFAACNNFGLTIFEFGMATPISQKSIRESIMNGAVQWCQASKSRKLAFLMGTRKRVGAKSALRSVVTHTLFDRNLLNMILQFVEPRATVLAKKLDEQIQAADARATLPLIVSAKARMIRRQETSF